LLADGGEAATRAIGGGWDAILLDLMLPTKDGFRDLPEIRRARVRTPILMLTANRRKQKK
jgi:DNA-binding response OmpR family regulator